MQALGQVATKLGWRYLLASLLGALVFGVVLAIPTAILDNPWFVRMTPVEPEQYVFWIATSLLSGALIATYLLPELRRGIASTGAGAGVLGVFAVGCPICNKLVVSLIGISGALNYFAPIQPLIGAAAVGLTSWALWIRYRALRNSSCAISPRVAPPS